MMDMPTIKRLFLAFPIPVPVATTLLQQAHSQAANTDIQFYQAEDLHLTICFLGAVPSAQLDPIRQQVGAITQQQVSFSVELKKLDFFSTRKQKIMVALSGLSLPLATLYRDISRAMQSLGYASDNRTFRPHVTLLHHANPLPVTQHHLALSFDVQELVLYESLVSQDQRYQTIDRFALG